MAQNSANNELMLHQRSVLAINPIAKERTMSNMEPSTPLNMTAVPSVIAKPGSLSIKLQMLNWEKEHWEGVSQNVKNAFQVVSNNQSRLQTWADQVHDGVNKLDSESAHCRETLDISLHSIEETKKDLEELTGEVSEMRLLLRRELDTGHTCTKQLLEATNDFIGLFIAGVGGDRQSALLARPAAGPAETGTETAQLSDLDVLENLSKRLGNQCVLLNDAFGAWNQWRASKDEQGMHFRKQTDELNKAADHTRQRLMQWRDLLKENSSVVDSLSTGLAETRGKIRVMEMVQVLQKDVDESIRKKADETEEMRITSEKRVNDVAAKLNRSISEVETSMTNSERLVSEQVSKLREDVRNLLVESLNPVNAYMNNMHVSASATRTDVDELQNQIPKLQARIKDVSEQLQQCDDQGQQQNRQLGSRLDTLAAESSSGVQRGQQELGDLQNSLRQLRQDLAGHLEQLHKGIAGNSQALEAIRLADLPKVNREFLILEQKVAKWVRTDPMPSKINEARLYALEARLAQEMECRLLFEESQSSRLSSRSMMVQEQGSSHSMGIALPALSRHTPRGQEDGLTARSHASSKARLSGRGSSRSLKGNGEQLEIVLA